MWLLVFIALSSAHLPEPNCEDRGVVEQLEEIYSFLTSSNQSVSTQLAHFSNATFLALSECDPLYVIDMSLAQSLYLSNITSSASIWDVVNASGWFDAANERRKREFDATLSRYPDDLMCERSRAVFLYGAISRSPVVAAESLSNITQSADAPDGIEVRLAFDLFNWISSFWGRYISKSIVEGYIQGYILPSLFLSELKRTLFFSVLRIPGLVPYDRYFCATSRPQFLQVHAAFAAVANACDVALRDLANIRDAVPRMSSVMSRGVKRAERAVIYGWLHEKNVSADRADQLMQDLAVHHNSIVQAIREGRYDL